MYHALFFSPRRKESSFNLGSAETKLLYTLHWLLLDAADECMLESESAGALDEGAFAYLYPMSAVTTFVYLFVPLASHVRESDFMQNLRLDNGKKIWKALWEQKQPDVECFSAHVRKTSLDSLEGHSKPPFQVKPRRRVVRDLKKIREKTKGGAHGIFLGERKWSLAAWESFSFFHHNEGFLHTIARGASRRSVHEVGPFFKGLAAGFKGSSL